MDTETLIERVLERANSHALTQQKGPYRIRLWGPVDFRNRPERWTVALEPYNDNDVTSGIGVTIRMALVNLENNLEQLLGNGDVSTWESEGGRVNG